jgi:hypothetical protein
MRHELPVSKGWPSSGGNIFAGNPGADVLACHKSVIISSGCGTRSTYQTVAELCEIEFRILVKYFCDPD